MREGAAVVALDLAPPPADAGFETIAMDVTSEDAVRKAMDDIDARHGKIDILVNAAGIEIEKTIEETSLEEWNRIFAINVTACS